MKPALRRARASTRPRSSGLDSRLRRRISQTMGLLLLLPVTCVITVATTSSPAAALLMHPVAGQEFQSWSAMLGPQQNSVGTPPVTGCNGTSSGWYSFSTSYLSDKDWARVCYKQLPGRVVVDFIEFAQFQWGCANGGSLASITQVTDSVYQGSLESPATPFARMDAAVAKIKGYYPMLINFSEHGFGCLNQQWYDFNTWSAHMDSGAGSYDITRGDLVTFPSIFDASVNENGVPMAPVVGYWGVQRFYASSSQQPVTAAATVQLHEADYNLNVPILQSQRPGSGWDHQVSPEPHWIQIPISSNVPADTPAPTPVPDPPGTGTPPQQPPTTTTTTPPPGSPPTTAPPVDNQPSGSFSSAAFTANAGSPYEIHVTGTASDPQASSVAVSFWSPGSGQWVGRMSTAGGQFDGNVVVPWTASNFHVCAVVENVGWQGPALNRFLGCLDPDRQPTGLLGSATYTGDALSVTFRGFASDPDTPWPLDIDFVTDDGVVQARTQTGAQSMAWIYGNAGYDITTTLPFSYMGLRVCAWAHDFGGHNDKQLGCLVPKSTPLGHFDNAIPAGLNRFSIRGWAYQPRYAPSALVKVVVGGTTTTTFANTVRPDVESAFPGLGNNRGFDVSVDVPAGGANVCVTALNQLGSEGFERSLGCQFVENHTPVGSLDSLKRKSPMTYNLSGWTADPLTTWSTFMDVWIDPGQPGATKLGHFAANLPRGDLASGWSTGINAGYGGNHGFDVTVTVPGTTPTGPHNLCAYGVTWDRPDDNRVIACQQINTDDLSSPMGSLDNISEVRWVNSSPQLNVTGWAIDPDVAEIVTNNVPDPASAALDIHLYWDANPTRYTYAGAANLNRADLAPTYSGWGLDHGYSVNVPMPDTPGSHTLCSYGINKLLGTNKLLGCKTVTTPGHDPTGNLESVSVPRWSNGPTYQLAGWSIDADGTAPTGIDVWWDPQDPQKATKITGLPVANLLRPDVEAAHPGYGQAHGFLVNVPPPATSGVHTLCAYGLNLAGTPGTSGVLGSCKSVTTTGHDPAGAFDLVQAGYNGTRGIRVAGWELDPDSTGTGTVHIYVDGIQKATLTDVDKPRADLWTSFFGWGPNHGFDSVIGGVGPGTHSVCAYGINTGPGTTNPLLGACKTITLGSDPVGGLDKVEAGFNGSAGLHVAGWELDPDTNATGSVHIYVDGVGKAILTDVNKPRADIGAAWPGYGDLHGYDTVIGGIPAGTHTVCAYGINTGAGSVNTSLGCKTVTLGSDPLGLLEVASKKSGAPTTLTVGGWTLDPDTTAALTVHVYVDAAKVGEVMANVPRPDVGAAYVGYGDGHGFNVDLPGVLAGLTTGNHTVCAYGIGVTAGGVIDNHNPLLGGCRTVTV